MERNIWVTFFSDLASRLAAGEEEIWTIDDLIEKTKTRDQSVRKRSFWLAVQRGDEYSDAAANAGLAVEFELDESGVQVERVTFRKVGR